MLYLVLFSRYGELLIESRKFFLPYVNYPSSQWNFTKIVGIRKLKFVRYRVACVICVISRFGRICRKHIAVILLSLHVPLHFRYFLSEYASEAIICNHCSFTNKVVSCTSAI